MVPPPSTINPDLLRVIHKALREARDAGIDRSGQTQRAVLQVMTLRPDLDAAEALALVRMVTVSAA